MFKCLLPPLMLIAVIAVIAVLAACNAVESITHAIAQTQAIATRLERSVGVKPTVGSKWKNASFTAITVTFHSVPPNKTVVEIEALSRQAIYAEFRKMPEQLVIAFSIKL